jgi:uncharacterized OsmC-like protein
MTLQRFLRLLTRYDLGANNRGICVETESVTGMPADLSRVHIQQMDGRKLRCQAGRHVIITDRKTADGGTDAGCTSGELLLVCVGSCAAGSTRRCLQEHGLPFDDLAVDVGLKPAASAGSRDVIVIEVFVSADIPKHNMTLIENAALSGGVASRLALGSEIEVLVHQVGAGGEERDDQDVE